MKIHRTEIEGLIYLEPKIFGDSRGWFYESWNKERYSEIGITEDFVQDNFSFSCRSVLRGLHYQKPYTQEKLVSVIEGNGFAILKLTTFFVNDNRKLTS